MISTVVATGLTLVGLWIMLFWLWRGYWVEVFRQRSFELRDELFDFARAGHVAFDHPSYQMLRNVFNGYIRFAHRLNASWILLFRAGLKYEEHAWMRDHDFKTGWENATRDMDPLVVSALNRFHDDMATLAGKQLLLASPILVALVAPLAIAILVLAGLPSKLLQTLARRARTDDAALALGVTATRA